MSFELLEDGETITKGGLGTAVAGGVVAIIGSNVDGKKSKGLCTSMKIWITVKNSHTDTIYINLIRAKTKTNSTLYKSAQNSAQKALSAVQIIADTSDTGDNFCSISVDAITEIQKFHELMKNGLITEDEFNAKKTQLLRL